MPLNDIHLCETTVTWYSLFVLKVLLYTSQPSDVRTTVINATMIQWRGRMIYTRSSNSHWWSQDIFSETETLAKTEVSRHETKQDIRRDETRLRHSENVRDLRHCRDAGVKTWDEPKQFNITSTRLHKAHITVTDRLSVWLAHITVTQSQSVTSSADYTDYKLHKTVLLKPYVSWAKYALS